MSIYRAPPPIKIPVEAQRLIHENGGVPPGLYDGDPTDFFKAMGHEAPKLLDPEEVRAEAKGRSSRLWKYWYLLNMILERHEATIQKRWRKKSIEARRAILKERWPDMPATHRPDYETYMIEYRHGLEPGSTHRAAYLWPYINQEDLCTPRALLLLLNARGRNMPGAFVYADKNAAHLGYLSEALKVDWLGKYVMLFSGQDPESYGVLVPFEHDPDAFPQLVKKIACIPSQGLDVLLMQECLLIFLLRCSLQILHDTPLEDLISPECPILPEPPSVSEYREGNLSMSVLASEAPYKLPGSLGLSRLRVLLGTRLDEAKDHFWALREDPGYFLDTLLATREHRPEMTLDARGRSHPMLKESRKDEFWDDIIIQMIGSACLPIDTYQNLFQQASALEGLQRKYASHISSEDDLPEEYLYALLRFRSDIGQEINDPSSGLGTSFVASPPMRNFFVTKPDHPNRVAMKESLPKDGIRERLISLIFLIQNDEQRHKYGIQDLVDEFERTLQMDKRAKDFVSPYVASLFADVSLLAECLRQLNLFHPWAEAFEHHLMKKQARLKDEFEEVAAPRREFFPDYRGTSILHLGHPQGRRFHYPADKRPTKANIDAMRSAERSLDLFWTSIDAHLMKKGKGKIEKTAIPNLLANPPTFRRTGEWIAPEKEKQMQSTPPQDAHVSELLSPTHFTRGVQPSSFADAIDHIQKRAKAKTRGTARPIAEERIDEVHDQPAEDVQPTFQIDKRAYKVFTTLFHEPSATSQPGEVSWLDFCHAMSSAGFSVEKLYGSVWSFQPTKLDVETAINFHEPHPSPKIPFYMARRIGRRLSRSYGWHGGMFVLTS